MNDTDDALVTKLELDTCPWNNEHYLASVVVKAKPAVTENVKNNIVILVDKSGSMSSVFDLVKTSLHTLVDNLGDDDKVSIVSYASTGKIECEGLTGKQKSKLNNVVNSLKASGSTYGEDGIEKAYQMAYKYFSHPKAFRDGKPENRYRIWQPSLNWLIIMKLILLIES